MNPQASLSQPHHLKFGRGFAKDMRFAKTDAKDLGYPDLPKNDWLDAFETRRPFRFGRVGREVYMDDYRYKALQTLTRARLDVIRNLTGENRRFANYLFLKCSGIAQGKDIPNSSVTTIALMERFETVDGLRSWILP